MAQISQVSQLRRYGGTDLSFGSVRRKANVFLCADELNRSPSRGGAREGTTYTAIDTHGSVWERCVDPRLRRGDRHLCSTQRCGNASLILESDDELEDGGEERVVL